MLTGRELARHEIERVWDIDRAEVVEAVYYLEHGSLVLKPERWEMAGWPAGEAAQYRPLLLQAFDRGGWFYGLFDDDRLIGVAVLDGKRIGRRGDLLQLKFMHLSCAHRHEGLGRRLFELCAARAREAGVRGMYISATPSQHTVDFYLRLGCVLTSDPDAELMALEPEDIHLEFAL
jgi:predicted N-acetyltransferase YhbS